MVLEEEHAIHAELVAFWSPLARDPCIEESFSMLNRRLALEEQALRYTQATEWPACPTLSPEVCKERLKRAPATSPGADGLRYSHLLALAPVVVPMLRSLFDQWVTIGSWPLAFQDTLLVCLLKEGSCNPLAGDVHPISLLSCASKILTQHLAQWMLGVVPALIHASQKGFLPGRGLTSALLALETQVFTSCEGALLLLDLAKAFPTIKQQWLLKAVAATGAPAWLVTSLRSLYARQRARFK